MTRLARVRDATPEDTLQILELQLQLRAHHAQLDPDNPRYQVDENEWLALIERDLRAENCLFLIAEADGNACGFVKLVFVEKPWGRACEMDTLVVGERWRGSGFGKTLVEAAEEAARIKGARAIRSNVLAANSHGQSFYRTLAYDEIAIRFGKTL